MVIETHEQYIAAVARFKELWRSVRQFGEPMSPDLIELHSLAEAIERYEVIQGWQ